MDSTLAEPERETASNHTATILCVEDEEVQLQLRRMVLEAAGYRVLMAQSGRQAVDMFRKNRVDAVILDYWMSGMNGLAVAGEIKRINPATPVIILSAYISLPDEGIGSVDIWLRKAEIDPEDLLGHLERLLSNRPTA